MLRQALATGESLRRQHERGKGEAGGHGRQPCARPSAPPQIPSRSGEMQRTGVAGARYGGRERRRLTRSFETPPRSTHPPTAPQDEREGGEVYVGPDASTGSAGTRGGGGAHSWRPDALRYKTRT